jgi:Putative DNA-binding domain
MAQSQTSTGFAAAKDLVSNPRVTLATELKSWLDPRVDEDRALLMRAILAMRNHEFGGMIAIGVSDDGTHLVPPSLDIDSAYEQQAIQAIVSKHASRSFEVEVHRVEFKGVRYPVIVVPGATDMPVICKSQIGQGLKPPLREGTIYVRTLDQSGVPSSAPAPWKDIEKLFETCFRNREANYSEFFSRILRAATPSEIHSLVTKAKDISAEAFQAFHGLTDFRNYACERFLNVVTAQQFDIGEIGFLDVALVIDGASERKWQNDGTNAFGFIVRSPYGISAEQLKKL